MNTIRFLFAILLLTLPLAATDCIPNCEFRTDWTMEVRGAYYYMPSKSIERVYTHQWLDYQVCLAKRVHPYVEVWGEVDWANKRGHMHERAGYYHTRLKNKTRMSILPISLGLKAIYPILPFVDIYAGAGVSASFLRIKSHCQSDYYSYYGVSHSPWKKAVYKNSIGGLFKVGVQYALCPSMFIDLFADYIVQSFDHFHKHDRRDVFKQKVDCSGLKAGIGLGVYF